MVFGDVLAAFSAVLVVALALPWIAHLVRRASSLAAELRDPLLGPSVPILATTAMLLSGTLLAWANTLGRTLVAVFAVLTLVGVSRSSPLGWPAAAA